MESYSDILLYITSWIRYLKVSSQYNVYINITNKQINKGCSTPLYILFTTLHSLKIMESLDNRFTSQVDFNSTEWLTSLSTSIKLKFCVIKRISHYSIDAPGQLLKVSVAYWAPVNTTDRIVIEYYIAI
jgi:hypothetical protein